MSESSFEAEPGGHRNAVDLLKQAVRMNQGIFLQEDITDVVPTDFCIGVAGYPEKHYEAPNMKMDLKYLKDKVDAGADYIITQMFFDNSKYFEFVKCCRESGITVPILPGIKPITNRKHINTLPRMFHVEIPENLANELQAVTTDEAARKVGIEWCIEQCKELIKHNVPLVHFYTMSNPGPVKAIVSKVF
jgi:methylenetetrahydrofolate reductase (NADPH)